MIDPEFWSDEKLLTVSRDARLLFIGTWNYADDQGKLRSNTVKIKAQIFPVDGDITPEIIGTLIEELLKIGVLIEYSVNGESYLLVKNFLDLLPKFRIGFRLFVFDIRRNHLITVGHLIAHNGSNLFRKFAPVLIG